MAKFKLIAHHRLNKSVFQIDLQPVTANDKFSFHPGQYATISFARGRRRSAVRCFSIVNAPNHEGTLSFAVRVYGRLTESLASMPVGQLCEIQGPFGNFVYDQGYDKEAVMFAAGIGVTPLMSMIRFATEKKLPNKLKLYYSVRNAEEAVFITELTDLQHQNPNFELIFIVSSGDLNGFPSQLALKGKVTSEHIHEAVNKLPQLTTYFICGTAKFMRHIDQHLVSNGVSSQQIFTESFAQQSSVSFKEGSWLAALPNVYKYATAGFAVLFGIILVSDLANTVEPASAASVNVTNQTSTSIPSQTDEAPIDEPTTAPVETPNVSQPTAVQPKATVKAAVTRPRSGAS